MLGIIGGTGIYSLGKFTECEVNTPYGFVRTYFGKIERIECVFIPRHGKNHEYPPHKINYRANIWALGQIGVRGVIATYAVGVISKFKPSDLIVAEDFIGFNTPITFYNDFKNGIKHIDFSEPYSKGMQFKLLSAAKNAEISLKTDGIIATTHGPRFETRAEINALKKMGANLVSMSNGYEAILFHELEIPIAGLCIATNYACGVMKKQLSHIEVVNIVAKKENDVNKIIAEFAKLC